MSEISQRKKISINNLRRTINHQLK